MTEQALQTLNNFDKLNQEQHKSIEQIIQSNQEKQDAHNIYVREMLSRIEAQTIKTNGRVTVLEHWRSRIGGIIIAISLVFSTILTLITLLK